MRHLRVCLTASLLLGVALAADTEYIDHLVDRLNVSWDMDAQVAAMEAHDELVKLGKDTVPACLRVIERGNGSARMWAAAALAETGDPRAVDPLLKLLTDPEPRVRMIATWHINRFAKQDPRIIPAIGKQMADTNEKVREQAVKVLGKFKLPPQALPSVRAATKCPDLYARADALRLVLRYDKKNARVEIPKLVESDADGLTRSAAVVNLLKIGKPDSNAAMLLVRCIGDRDPLVVEAALKTLFEAFKEPPFTRDDLRQIVAGIRLKIPAAIERPEARVRELALPMYAHFYKERAFSKVHDLLKQDPSPVVRAAAAKSLTRTGVRDIRLYGALFEALDDAAPEPRIAAFRTLAGLAHDEKTPPKYAGGIRKMLAMKADAFLGDREASVREAAYPIVGGLLKDKIVPKLIHAAKSEHEPSLRRAALAGLFATRVRTEPVLEALVAAVGDADMDVNTVATKMVRSAIKQVPEDQQPQIEASLLAQLAALAKHSDASIRARALPVLGMVGKAKAVDQILDVIQHDQDAAARKAAVEGLMRTKVVQARCVDVCVKALDDETSGVRELAFKYVNYMLRKHVSRDIKLEFSPRAETPLDKRQEQAAEVAKAWRQQRAKFEQACDQAPSKP